LYGISAYCHDYENPLPESNVNAGTTLKSKRKDRDSPEAAGLAFSGVPEHMGANPPANRKKYLDLAFFKIKLINRQACLAQLWQRRQ
jgi:hypothetical protein